MKYSAFLIFALFSCNQPPFFGMRSGIIISTSIQDSFVCFTEYNEKSIHYPDTSLPALKPYRKVLKYQKPCYLYRTRDKWEDYIESLPSDTLSIFILDAKVFDDSSWQTIKDKYLVLRRFDLSAQQLINSNFKITYP